MSYTMKPSGVEWVGDIPAHWTLNRVKHVFKEVSVKGFPNETLLAATQSQGVIPKAMVGWRTVEAKQDGRENFKLVQPGTFVISLRSFEGGIEYSNYRGIISSAYTVLDSQININKAYFKHMFKSHSFIEGLRIHQKGIRDGQSITFSTWANDQLICPPLSEQQAIASFLDDRTSAIDSKISALEEKEQSLAELRKSIIHEAVTKGLDPKVPMKASGVDWIGDIPAHWEVKRLKDTISKTVSGGTPTSGNSNYYSSTGMPWVTIGDMSNRHFIFSTKEHITDAAITEKKLKIIPSGTILYSMYASVGLTSKLRIDATINQAILALFFKKSVDSNFMKYSLDGHRNRILNTTAGTTQMNLNAEKVKNIELLMCSLEEQQAIAAYLDERTSVIDQSIDTVKKEIEALQELRKSLIHEAVTGKLDVADFGYNY